MKILFQDNFIAREDAKVDIEDRGYQFGDGIYEVIKVYNGKPFTFIEHMKRLERSADELHLSLPYSVQQIEENILELIEKNQLVNGHVYLQITRGVSERVHNFPERSTSMLVAYTKEAGRPIKQHEHGIKTVLTDDIRWLRCDIKSLNLLGNVLAKQKAKDQGAVEAIFHRGETVTEGSSSNLFIVKDGIMYTHPKTNLILHGITRDVCIQLANNLDVQIVEKAFTIDELLQADEVMITSTTMEITPVVKVDEQDIANGYPGEVTKRLQVEFNKLINS
jgi:D-alanine transaminase